MNSTTRWRHYWLPTCMLLVAIIHTVSTETRVVCYYTNWSVYRPGTAKFSPQNINPYLCTHLIYAFGGFTKENSLKPFDKYQDIEKGGYAKFTGLKTYNKNLKTMLAIGGWNEGSSRFSPMVASPDRRKELVKNTVKFLRLNHFDGLDLDWEYPSFRDGGKPRDKENYAQLVQELREEFDREAEKTGRPRLLLTMAVPAGIEYINKGYDIPKLNKYLDWMNILSYDYHSAFEPAVNHHSPLYPLEEDNEYNFDGDLNIDHTIKHYLKLGANPSKLVLGIPTYGRSYTLFNPDANELGAPADGPGEMGDATRENGYLAFYEICENLKENDWKVVQPKPDAMGPYAYKDNQWVSYDDELIVKKKSIYVAENNLGGIMFWSIDNDDFRGNCYNKPYPLIEAAKEALITASSSKTEDNLVKPRKPNIRSRRPTSSKKEEISTTRVQNSGGPQTFEDASSTSGRKRTRPTSRSKPRSEDATPAEQQEQRKRTRARGQGRRRKTTTTTQATTVATTPSTLPTTPMYKTPEPPTTPDPGGDFKCEEDGFFPHPRDCKRYFWCLSGPADLGIIAHQFTCPAGLYFNKAADSCDYTQNVLCKKKQQTTSTSAPTTTSATTTTTSAPTRKAPPRITAATSRTTFLYTSTSTTTPEPEYYDEYEYDDEEDLEDGPRRGEPDSEEDPRVIKELIDLIKKVGGVEELEKFLKLQEDGSMSVTHSGSTTPASISRSLYERVLQSRANAAKPNSDSASTTKSRNSLSYSTINRSRQSSQNEGLEKPESISENTVKRSNSRYAPQNEGLEKPETENEGSKRGRPQYTTISRQRSSTEKISESEDEEIEDDDEEVQTKNTRQPPSRNTPEYVTIRRSRPTSSTDAEIEEEKEETSSRNSIVRSRQRGIPGKTDDETTESTQRPEYVTIRRNRPSTEEPTTSKYTTIQRRRPSTESIEIETSSDTGSTKSRPTTQISEETLEKEKRYRSTTLPTTEEASTLTTLTDVTLEDNKKTTTEKEATVTENTEVKSTLEEITDSTSEKTTTQASVTELPRQSTTNNDGSIGATNQINEPKEDTSEKTSPAPQLLRPRPFASRVRSTTTQKSADITEAATKKVSDTGRPIIRKFQSGNRYRTQNTQSQLDISSDSNIRLTTEENIVGTQETDTKREQEYRRRIANRGRSKFTAPTSTVGPTVARRRRPVQQDYEDDYDDIQRTYRPSVLADLSSLTSADIAFRANGNRKHIRRRPVNPTSSTTTEGSTTSGLKTGPRTLTLARKQIDPNNFGRSNRRIVTQNQKPIDISTTESSIPVEVTTRYYVPKSRPSFAALIKTTTQKVILEQEESETTRIKFSEAPPLTRVTEQEAVDNNEVTEAISLSTGLPFDSTESHSDKEYKIVKPEDNEVTDIPYDASTFTTEDQSSSLSTEDATTVPLITERYFDRKIIPSTKSVIEETESPKINRSRKIFATNRRLRTTTPNSAETESSSTETIRTTPDFRRTRPSLITPRNPNLTRSRQNDFETNTTSESNRGLVKRIRPIGVTQKIDEEEKIKLSETNISEHDYTGTAQNLPENDSGKARRRKIIRRIRPSKDTIYSKDEDLESKRIKVTDKSVLTEDDKIDGVKVRGKKTFLDLTTQKDETITEPEFGKRKSNADVFSKSESIDILRSKHIRNEDLEANIAKDENDTRTRQGKTSILEEAQTTDSENQNIETSTPDTELEQTDDYHTAITETSNQDTTKRLQVSSLSTNELRNRRLRLNGTVKAQIIDNEDKITTAETPSTFRPRTLVRKFRPGVPESTTRLSSTRNTGRRKIIRRLRPTTTSTTEQDIPESTFTEIPISSTTENSISLTPTEENILTTIPLDEEITSTPNEEMTELPSTLEDTDETTIFSTESTTTTTSPRPTRPSLIGRSRPAYRPRSRPPINTTPVTIQSRRRFNGLNRNEATTEKGTDREEIEDGIIDSKLKKLYNRKQKLGLNVRSTTERAKVTEEDIETVDINQEVVSDVSTTTTETSLTEIPEVVTTDSSSDLTTIFEDTETITIFTTEIPTTMNETRQDSTTESIIEAEIKFSTASEITEDTTGAQTIKSTASSNVNEETSSESMTEIGTTESNTELMPTTELPGETTIILEATEQPVPQSSTVSTTTEDSSSEGSTSEATTSENEKTESDKSHKLIRYKPSDRPKLKINLNRTETEDRNENSDSKTRKFTPSRNINQRNRSKLAYRKDTSTERSKDTSERVFLPKGRKLERPGLQQNLNNPEDGKKIEEEEEEKDSGLKSERTYYPTLRPVSESFNFYKNQESVDGQQIYREEELDDEEKQPPVIISPVVKYLETIRNNQEVISTTLDQPEEAEDEDFEEDEEYVDEEDGELGDDSESKDESTKFNIPLSNGPSTDRQNLPTRVANRPSYKPNRPIVSNRPFNPNDNKTQINRPIEPSRPTNRPSGGRNYPRRFNQPVDASSTTESLIGVNIEAVNARNKNLFTKNRKTNIPHPVSSTVSSESTTPTIEISQVTEETILPEPTTEQLSTLHHVFAEPDLPETTTPSMIETSTQYNFTAAQLQAARSLERLIEVNRIVEVSLKEDKIRNSSGVVESRVMLEKVPHLDRIGAVNRVTVIKVVDGNNETIENFPSNHAVTLNEIVTGKRLDTSQKIDIVARLHAPDINLTKLNILNNTLEIIETQRRDDQSTETISQTTILPTEVVEGEKIPEGVPVHVVDGPKILDEIINGTVAVSQNNDKEEKKFEIYSRSNVIDYSHRELDPIQIIASAQPANIDDNKQGRKLAIDSVSAVNNYNVRPIFIEATTLPLEALFQTNSPDYKILKQNGGVTPLPTLREVTGKGNLVDDDQDLLESRNHNGRVRIRILGQDNDFDQNEKTTNPVFAPIRLLSEEEKKILVDPFTLKAEVVEVTSKPSEEIKIAPIEVTLGEPQTVKVPVFRVESSQSSSTTNNLKRESPSYFNQEVIFGGSTTDRSNEGTTVDNFKTVSSNIDSSKISSPNIETDNSKSV